jgi:hypothetical protein
MAGLVEWCETGIKKWVLRLGPDHRVAYPVVCNRATNGSVNGQQISRQSGRLASKSELWAETFAGI